MLITGPEICHVDRCRHGCTSETGCKGIEGWRLADEATRAAFEADAHQRYPGIQLHKTRTSDGYINPCWNADWQLWLRAWNAARSPAHHTGGSTPDGGKNDE